MPELKTTIKSITPVTDRIRAFLLAAEGTDHLPPFEAGAHVDVGLADGMTRSYSLISFEPVADLPQAYLIAVQLEPDGKGGSRQMHQLSQGDPLTITVPKNDFALDADHPAVLLAGGIGITPMISMASTLKQKGQAFKFHYAARSADVMAYRAELQDAFPDEMQLHLDDDPETALDLDAVIAELTDPTHLYVCGPRGMIDAAKALAEEGGVPADRIHFELFEAASQEADDAPFEVELSSTGQVFTVAAGQSIIEALEDGGVDVMYDCQRGDCGICQCDVISGTPDHRDVVLSQTERDSGKVMQICVSRSKSARLVLDL